MKKPLLITLGITLILLILALWGYLMFFGTPESSQEVFSDLGFDITERPVTIREETPDNSPATLVDTQGEALRQLTTRPTAGFTTFFSSSTQSDMVRYAEQGTGHIYEINLTTGEERRVSGTTIPRVTEAQFSDDGTYVALTSITQSIRDVFAGTITASADSGSITGQNLPPGADEIDLDGSKVYYILADEEGTTGFRLDLATNDQAILFEVPFTQIRMIWPYSEIYFYNRVATAFQSGLYQITSTGFTPISRAAFGRVALLNDEMTVLTETTTTELIATAQVRGGSKETPLGVVTLPEKCVFDAIVADTLLCAAPIETPDQNYLTAWYQGVVTSNDFLWEVDLTTGEAALLSDFTGESGRTIDVRAMQSDAVTNNLYFINKIDNTLWLYDLLVS